MNWFLSVCRTGCKRLGIIELSSILNFPLSLTGLTPHKGAKP